MARAINIQGLKNIMNDRTLVPESAVGKGRTRLFVQGDGNVIDVKDKEGNYVQSVVEPGSVFQKKLFNFKANSAIAMASARNQELLKEGIRAEKAGNSEKASELFNKYLNAVQLSVSIPLPSSIAGKLSAGVEIAATVVKITTDNGSFLTIDPKTISVMEPETYGKTSFDINAFMDEEEESDDSTTVENVLAGDEFSQMDRKALAKYVADNELEIAFSKKTTDDQLRDLIRAAVAEEV